MIDTFQAWEEKLILYDLTAAANLGGSRIRSRPLQIGSDADETVPISLHRR
jgi:hypothetical protein